MKNRMNSISKNKLRDLQMMQLEMLKVLDQICRKHDIHYSLFAGTALGAVRHQGFIPWDDDLDVVMLREDYEKFLLVAPDEVGEDYFIQKEFSEHWPMQFSKMRKNQTAFIERYIPKDLEIHMGVYIDIFPCDNLYERKAGQLLQFIASKVLIAHALDCRGYLTDSKLKKMFLVVSRVLPWKLCRRLCILKSRADSSQVHVFLGAASKMSHSVFPRAWIENTVQMKFEDGYFPVSANYDDLLTTLYGDYMTPTPEDERVYKVHGEIVDLEHSYTEYRDAQKTMKFDKYTRSIR